MKRKWFILILFFSVLLSGATFSEIKINVSPIEMGNLLPVPYDCIVYFGHNDKVAALYSADCPGKVEGWIYPASNTSGDFIFQWNQETLILRPIGPGKNQMNLFRRE
jgi:hypothetical protein